MRVNHEPEHLICNNNLQLCLSLYLILKEEKVMVENLYEAPKIVYMLYSLTPLDV